MKKVNSIFLFTVCISILGCSGIKVTTDSEKSTDFSKYKSFSFLGWQDDSDKILNDFDKKRIRDAFKDEFKKRDLKYKESDGDMTISLFLVVNKETSVTAYTNYYGGGGYGRYRRYGYGWGGSSTTSYSENDYLKGTLVMDVFDEKTGDQIWQGVAVKTVEEKPEKREKSIPKTITALMKKFPVNAAD
ncbi:MAG: DUF4136 domain-containing protein [Cytophagales bacterium]|nr:DUF4136 domain-containing protein [Cytophagales bacterium]